MQEQIKVLLNQGLSIRKVALALGISRQTVRKFGMDQPADVSGAGAATSESASDAAIDWQDVAKQARSTRDERGDFIPESVLVRGHTR